MMRESMTRTAADMGEDAAIALLRKQFGTDRMNAAKAGVVRHLGSFKTEAEAYAAYCGAKAKLHTFNPALRDDLRLTEAR